MSGVGVHAVFGPFFHNGTLQTAAKLYLYEPGTADLRPAYTDRLLQISAHNPMTSDQNGLFTAYFSGLYKLVVKSTDGSAVLMQASEAAFFHAPSLSGTDEQLRIGPEGDLGEAEDTLRRWIRMIGHWGDPATPGSRSEGDRIVILESAGFKTALGMNFDNGIWVQAHGFGTAPAFSVWSGDEAGSVPLERFRVTFDGRVKALSKQHIPVVLTASLPAAAAGEDGSILIEDNGTGDRNLIIYAGGQRFRIDGGAAF